MSRKKLKPIYDLLEVGNNKKVIQEVDKQWTKSTTQKASRSQDDTDDEIIAKSLKCLALVRLGKQSDANLIFNELLNKNTTDENALSIMMQYCKETQQLTKIVSFYENALQKDSKNEEIMNSLFYAYVRNYDFLKQQQISLKLYRQTNVMIYCYWQAVSNVMLASINPKQSTLYLQLAEKIFEKAYNEKKMELNGEFQFYINLLEKSGKYTLALQLIDNLSKEDEFKIGENNYKIRKQINLLNLLAKQQQQDQNAETLVKLKEKCEEYLRDNTDDWLILKQYLNCTLSLYRSSKNEEILRNCLKFLQNLYENVKYNKGPLLAILELNQLLNDDGILLDLNETLQVLIKNFHHKPGVFHDLVYFNGLIKKQNLSGHVLNELKYDKIDSVDDIYRLIAYWQFYYYENENKLNDSQIEQLKLFYEKGLKFGEHLLHTEQQYSDSLLILYIFAKFNLNVRSNKLDTYTGLISDLNDGLVKSKTNYQLKFCLIYLYSHLGVYNRIYSLYDSMDIKNIQFYSLSYPILFTCVGLFGVFEASTQVLLKQIHSFYLNNLFDMTNSMCNCYKYGTFLKINDIYEFNLSLRKSLSLHMCVYLNFYVKLNSVELNNTLQAQAYFESYDADLKNLSSCVVTSTNGLTSIDIDGLIDHNDLNIFENVLSDANAGHLTESYKNLVRENKILFYYRHLCVKLLHGCVRRSLGETSAVASIGNYLVKLNEFLLETYLNDFKISDDNSGGDGGVLFLNEFKSNYLKFYLKYKFFDLNLSFFEFFAKLYAVDDLMAFYEADKLNNNVALNAIQTQFDGFTSGFKQNLTTLCVGDDFFHVNSNLIEFLSCTYEATQFVFHLLVTYTQTPVVYQVWQEKYKKSKKKKSIYINISTGFDLFTQLHASLIDLYRYIIEFVRDHLKLRVNNDTGDNENKVLCDVRASYTSTFNNFTIQFDTKLKQLQQLATI